MEAALPSIGLPVRLAPTTRREIFAQGLAATEEGKPVIHGENAAAGRRAS